MPTVQPAVARPLKTVSNAKELEDKIFRVRFFNEAERAAHQTKVIGGKLHARDATGRFKPLTTTGNIELGLLKREQVINRAIFAFSGTELLTSMNDVIGIVGPGDIYKHSTLTAGMESAANGEIGVVNGEVVYLSNKSGHYPGSLDNWMQLIGWLEGQGVDLSKVKVKVKLYPPEGSDGTQGYERIGNATAQNFAMRLQLGDFTGERFSREGKRILEFKFGSIVADRGPTGTVDMAHSLAGPIPGRVLQKGFDAGMKAFDSIIVGKKNVTYQFDLDVSRLDKLKSSFLNVFRSAKKEEQIDESREFPVSLTELAELGVEIDRRRLTQASTLYDLN